MALSAERAFDEFEDLGSKSIIKALLYGVLDESDREWVRANAFNWASTLAQLSQ